MCARAGCFSLRRSGTAKEKRWCVCGPQGTVARGGNGEVGAVLALQQYQPVMFAVLPKEGTAVLDELPKCLKWHHFWCCLCSASLRPLPRRSTCVALFSSIPGHRSVHNNCVCSEQPSLLDGRKFSRCAAGCCFQHTRIFSCVPILCAMYCILRRYDLSCSNRKARNSPAIAAAQISFGELGEKKRCRTAQHAVHPHRTAVVRCFVLLLSSCDTIVDFSWSRRPLKPSRSEGGRFVLA